MRVKVMALDMFTYLNANSNIFLLIIYINFFYYLFIKIRYFSGMEQD